MDPQQIPFESLEPIEIRNRMARGERLQLIDVREVPEWEIARIEGSLLRPLTQVMEWAPSLEADGGPYVLICHHGIRSAQACLYLASLGVRGLVNMSGGIERWSQTVDASVPRY